MYGSDHALLPNKRANLTTRKVGILLRELSDDEDNDDGSVVGEVLGDPWHDGFHSYLNSRDQLGTLSIVEWWGVRAPNKCPT